MKLCCSLNIACTSFVLDALSGFRTVRLGLRLYSYPIMAAGNHQQRIKKIYNNCVCYLFVPCPGVTDWGYGVVVNVLRQAQEGQGRGPAENSGNVQANYTVDILLCCSPGSSKSGQLQTAQIEDPASEMQVFRHD